MRVLFVCTGNICRSPMAEYLLRTSLLSRGVGDVMVSSAGTHGLVGEPMQSDAAAALGHLNTAGFRARRLTDVLVAESDLVLAASREHRAAAVTMHPKHAARTFTIREFDRLLSGVDLTTLGDRREGLVFAAAAQRGIVRADRPSDDDITDPYGGPASGYAPCASLIARSLQRFADLLAG